MSCDRQRFDVICLSCLLLSLIVLYNTATTRGFIGGMLEQCIIGSHSIIHYIVVRGNANKQAIRQSIATTDMWTYFIIFGSPMSSSATNVSRLFPSQF